jgi:hypothetical protein
MRQLSPSGQQTINDIAWRHGFSPEGTMCMLDAVINGNGSMAQFSHPDFSGSGQWMRGGMTMVSDMFNNQLKGRVDALCSELSNLVANQPDLLRSGGSFQSQSQSSGNQPPQTQFNQSGGGSGNSALQGGNGFGPASLFVPPAPGQGSDWWPSDLRWPDSTGAQNNVRYAYFSQAHRLVIDLNGTVTVYDTLDHQIGGFSQQQSVGGTLSFNSQYGLMDVAQLPVISSNGVPPQAPVPQYPTAPAVAQTWAPVAPAAAAASPMSSASGGGHGNSNDVFATIERLADLRAKGILSDEEFATKKAELLSRL